MRYRVRLPAAFVTVTGAAAAYLAYADAHELHVRWHVLILLPAMPWLDPMVQSLVALRPLGMRLRPSTLWAVWTVGVLVNAALLGLAGKWMDERRAYRRGAEPAPVGGDLPTNERMPWI
jgi:hypothetical protein